MGTKIFSAIDLGFKQPPGICPDCATHGMEHTDSGVAFVYCYHNLTGAWRAPTQCWKVVENIDAHNFKRAVLTAVEILELSVAELVGGAAAPKNHTTH